MRSRNIKPSFFKNEDLAAVPMSARLLFIGLWCLCDREGRLNDIPARIKVEIFPYDNFGVDKLLDQLVAKSFIVRYEADGQRYIQIVNFLKHQDPHYKEKLSEIPPPPNHIGGKVIASGVSELIRQDVFKRDGGKCKVCSSNKDLSLDHIIPRSDGGTNEIENLQTLCRRCNSAKNNRRARVKVGQTSANDRPMIGVSSPELTLGQSPLIPDSPILNPESLLLSGAPAPDKGVSSAAPGEGEFSHLNDVEKTVMVYKLVLGFEADDKGWDERNFERFSKPAKELLEIFKGDGPRASQYIEAFAADSVARGLNFTLETMVKNFDEWRLKNGDPRTATLTV